MSVYGLQRVLTCETMLIFPCSGGVRICVLSLVCSCVCAGPLHLSNYIHCWFPCSPPVLINLSNVRCMLSCSM